MILESIGAGLCFFLAGYLSGVISRHKEHKIAMKLAKID